jgi:hypothetical protein
MDALRLIIARACAVDQPVHDGIVWPAVVDTFMEVCETRQVRETLLRAPGMQVRTHIAVQDLVRNMVSQIQACLCKDRLEWEDKELDIRDENGTAYRSYICWHVAEMRESRRVTIIARSHEEALCLYVQPHMDNVPVLPGVAQARTWLERQELEIVIRSDHIIYQERKEPDFRIFHTQQKDRS